MFSDFLFVCFICLCVSEKVYKFYLVNRDFILDKWIGSWKIKCIYIAKLTQYNNSIFICIVLYGLYKCLCVNVIS